MDTLYKKTIRLFPLFLMLVLTGCGYQQFKTDLFSSFEHESQVGPTGLAWDGKNLVMASGDQILFARNISTDPYYTFSKDSLINGGAYTSGRFPGPERRPMDICGMTWEGECCGEGFLWLVDMKRDQILKLKPNRELVLKMDSPVKKPNGIAFDGHGLWLVSKSSRKIVHFNPELQAIVNVYFSPVARPAGLAWERGGYIWVVGVDDCRSAAGECTDARLVRLNIETGRFTHEMKLPPMLSTPSSVALTDDHFWVGDFNLNRVFKIPFKERKMKELTIKPNDFS